MGWTLNCQTVIVFYVGFILTLQALHSSKYLFLLFKDWNSNSQLAI